jgi:hypothetical protein
MLGFYMLLALTVYALAVCLYGWWNDPHTRLRRSIRRMTRAIGLELMPAMRALNKAAGEAARSFQEFAKAMQGGGRGGN